MPQKLLLFSSFTLLALVVFGRPEGTPASIAPDVSAPDSNAAAAVEPGSTSSAAYGTDALANTTFDPNSFMQGASFETGAGAPQADAPVATSA
ncbi:hypothetical protein JCM11641_003114 [Rhodosporidiobolus odoratus]